VIALIALGVAGTAVAYLLGHKRRAFVWGLASGVLAALLTRSRQQPVQPPAAVLAAPPTPRPRKARPRQPVVIESDHGCDCDGYCDCA